MSDYERTGALCRQLARAVGHREDTAFAQCACSNTGHTPDHTHAHTRELVRFCRPLLQGVHMPRAHKHGNTKTHTNAPLVPSPRMSYRGCPAGEQGRPLSIFIPWESCLWGFRWELAAARGLPLLFNKPHPSYPGCTALNPDCVTGSYRVKVTTQCALQSQTSLPY